MTAVMSAQTKSTTSECDLDMTFERVLSIQITRHLTVSNMTVQQRWTTDVPPQKCSTFYMHVHYHSRLLCFHLFQQIEANQPCVSPFTCVFLLRVRQFIKCFTNHCFLCAKRKENSMKRNTNHSKLSECIFKLQSLPLNTVGRGASNQWRNTIIKYPVYPLMPFQYNLNITHLICEIRVKDISLTQCVSMRKWPRSICESSLAKLTDSI